MNRQELVEMIMGRAGLSRKEARWLVDTFCETIIQGLENQDRVEFRGFGVFKKVKRHQADFVNPKNHQLYSGGDIQTLLFQGSTEIK